jgi:uncharacterized membrane protein
MSAVRVHIAESLIGCQNRRPKSKISTQIPLRSLDHGKHFPSIKVSREDVKLRANQQRRSKTIATATIAAAATPSPVFFPTGWALWACIAACAAISQIIERRTRIGVFLSAPLLSTFLALFAAGFNIIPTTAPAYDTIRTYLMPIAAALYLLESDISKLITSAGQSIIAFLNGTLGTVIGTVIAFSLVGKYLGPDGPKVAAALCASYIGGSVNFAAVSGLLGLTAGSPLAAAMVADNLAMAAYIAVLMSIPAKLPAFLLEMSTNNDKEEGNSSKKVTSESVGLAMAAATAACCAGNALSILIGFSSGGLAFTALIASVLATIASYLHRNLNKSTSPRENQGAGGISGFDGAEAIGGALMMFFFATIGAAAGSFRALRSSGWLLLFISIQLSIQLTISLGLGRVMKIPMPVILIASNANVGGPATAAAMAGAKGWTSLIQPAVVTGALGYAIANGIGLAMGTWLGCIRIY